MFNLKKGDIAIVVVRGEKKLLRLTEEPCLYEDEDTETLIGYKFEFDKAWEMILQPMKHGAEIMMDRGFIPIYQAMSMSGTTFLLIPTSEIITVGKLDPSSRDYKELSAEAAGITLA